MGSRLVSFKGGTWRGRTTLATNDRGDRRCVDITNGYVSLDGHEIRSFPGWRTLIDLSEENNPDGGYARYVIDAMRPVFQEVSPTQYYVEEYLGGTSAKQTLYSRAKPIWLEWFEQVGDQIVIGGITRFREDPIYSAARATLTPTHVSKDANNQFFFTMSDSVAARTTTDAGGASLNGLVAGDVIYPEGLTVASNPTLQTELDNIVNGRAHLITSIAGLNIGIQTQTSVTLATVALTDGEIHRIRPNRSDSYPTPTGADPYDPSSDARIDDWNALTTWRIIPTLSLNANNACLHECHPAWVANRQRDFSDEEHYYAEGILVGGTTRGISRREQKELPYRMVPEPAGDRIIIAAPGYNCLFQVPLMVPNNPDNWPLTPAVDNLGIQWFGNDIYDRPRALGVPKCRLIDSPYTPMQASPSDSATGVVHFATAIAASPQFSFPPGTYRMCCTYQDDITGEEGDPSEVVEFTVPANDYAYIIYLTYFHPGYIMPECLAFRLNVYLSDTDGESMGFYKSFDLRAEGASTSQHLGVAMDTGSPYQLSGKYGFFAGGSPTDFNAVKEWRRQALPIPRAGLGVIDFFRPPLIVGMPRGASCARMVRDVMIAVGHQGTIGPSRSLYKQFGTIRLQDGTELFEATNRIYTQIHGDNFLTYSDGAQTDGFGVAGRAYPDSCEGIEAISGDLLPTGMGRYFVIDKVLNRMARSLLDVAGHNDAATERLQTTRPVADVDFGASPSDPEFPTLSLTDRAYYLKMFKGQMQIADPGAPHRVTTVADFGIQLLDPNRDDDCHSICQLAGNAIVCSRKETYFFSWSRSAGASKPTVISLDHGCITPNGMVSFDGGVAWISERGPVAMGASLQFVGADVQEDFTGTNRRYVTDTQGFMRHTWGCHDSARGLVLWGMLTKDPLATHSYSDGAGGTILTQQADDNQLSRAPCNEVLIWSYRTGSFSRWVPPAGMEIIWMREIRVKDEADTRNTIVRLAALTADNRIMIFEDGWNDCNPTAMTTTTTAASTGSVTLVTTAGGWVTDGVANGGNLGRAQVAAASPDWTSFLVRPAQLVQAFNDDNEILWETTVESADPATNTITLAAAQEWESGQTIRVGARQSMVIETTYLGAEELMNFSAKGIQVRYTLHGSGRANATVTALKSDLSTAASPLPVDFSGDIGMLDLGTETGHRHARRRSFQGAVDGPEVACKVTISGEAQVRIADISLESD